MLCPGYVLRFHMLYFVFQYPLNFTKYHCIYWIVPPVSKYVSYHTALPLPNSFTFSFLNNPAAFHTLWLRSLERVCKCGSYIFTDLRLTLSGVDQTVSLVCLTRLLSEQTVSVSSQSLIATKTDVIPLANLTSLIPVDRCVVIPTHWNYFGPWWEDYLTVYLHTYTWIHACIHASLHVCVLVHKTHTHTHARMHERTHARTHASC